MFKKKAAKLFMAAAVTALTVVGATGCGEKKEIEFWNLCTGPDGENMVALIDGFNATNPEYKIKKCDDGRRGFIYEDTYRSQFRDGDS